MQREVEIQIIAQNSIRKEAKLPILLQFKSEQSQLILWPLEMEKNFVKMETRKCSCSFSTTTFKLPFSFSALSSDLDMDTDCPESLFSE